MTRPRRCVTSPASATSSPARMRSSVDLPPPFGPITPRRAPGSTSKSSPLRIEREPKLLPMPRAAISAMDETVATPVRHVVVLRDEFRAGGTRARRGGDTPRPTGGRRRRCTTPASSARARPGPRACRGRAAPARRARGSGRSARGSASSLCGQPPFHGSTSQAATRSPSASPRSTIAWRLAAAGSIARPCAMSLMPPWTISTSAPSTASSKRAAISSVRSPQIPKLRNSSSGCSNPAQCSHCPSGSPARRRESQ